MSDIFLSYAREDHARAKQLAGALEQQGWSVFLDLTILAGRTWPGIIETELESARCVVVAWTAASLRSDWVKEEAEEGKGRKILVPIRLEDVRPPLGFRSIQAENFIQWAGDTQAPEFMRLTRAIADLLGPPSAHAAIVATAGPGAEQIRPLIKPTSSPKVIDPNKPFRDALSVGGFGPEMVIVPRGTFRMGDLSGKGAKNERPVRSVSFANAFAIGRYPVTFEEFDRYVQASGRRKPNDFDWGRGNRPVVDVSWQDACGYAQWLSEQTGKAYRLPSEAEWEYAARAETETEYWWGDDIGSNRANCAGSGCEWSGKRTAPAGSFPANPWGLHDTAGNVWEWVQDRWHGNYQGAPENGSAWESGDSQARVLRGGSWNDNPHDARASYRLNLVPAHRYDYVGFRLVCSLPITGL